MNENREIGGCFVPQTILQRDRIVKDSHLWYDNPVAVNGGLRLTNNATTYPRPATQKDMTISGLQNTLIIDDKEVNVIEFPHQRAQLVTSFTQGAV